jgi:type III secretion protein Q
MVMAVEFNLTGWDDSSEGDQRSSHGECAVDSGSIAAMLPTIDAATRDIVNEWLSRRSAPVFHLGEERFEIGWLDSAGGALALVIELNVGAHRALLALDGLAAFEPLLVGEPFLLLPEALRDLAIHRLLARVLVQAPAALREALDVRAVHWNGPQLPDWNCCLPFVLRRQPEGTQLLGCLLVESAQGLRWLHETLPVDASSERARLNLQVPLRLALGRSLLPARAFQELEPGDVVWIESASIARDGVAVELTAPRNRIGWNCRVRHRSLRVASAGVQGAAIVNAFSPPTPPSAARPQLSGVQTMEAQRWQLDVPVTFDLGELHLKTSELELLQPGHIIELQQDVSTIVVALRIGERLVARGTLVAIGKRLGVRVSTILAQPESAAPSVPKIVV